MFFKKSNHRIITVGAIFVALLFFSGCKKLKTKDPIVYSITAVMPADGTPVPNVKFKIVEYKDKTKWGKNTGDSEPTGWEINGVTDSQGKASGEFMGVRKTNYDYFIYFDYSTISLPSGINDVSIDGPEYAYLARSTPNGNDYHVRVIPYTSYHFKVENVNCVDANDKMRFKTINYDVRPNSTFDLVPWSNYFEGCGLHLDYTSNHILSGHAVYQIEVIRNGEVDTNYIDTFNMLPNMVNQVYLEY